MRSKSLILVGLVGAGVLSIVATVAAATELWWLLAAALMILLSAACIAALDADRRAISLRAHVTKEIKRIRADVTSSRGAVADPEQDVLGAVRLLQAQYTGRLDRLQASIEDTLGTPGVSDRGHAHVDQRPTE